MAQSRARLEASFAHQQFRHNRYLDEHHIKEAMRFHVLGIGSIGTLISHHLRLALPASPISLIVKTAHGFPSTRLYPRGTPGNKPVSLSVEREGKVSSSDGYDLEVWHDGRAERVMRAERQAEEDEFDLEEPPNGPISSLIVCLKTSATMFAMQTLRDRLSPSSVITLIQNGMGVYDELCSSLWPDPKTRPYFVIGTTTHGATRNKEGGFVSHRSKPGEGEFKWGVVPDPRKEVDMEAWLWGRPVSSTPILAPPPSPALPLRPTPRSSTDITHLSDTITGLLSISQLSPLLLPMPHLHHELLLKLALNSVINPLTAVLGAGSLPNGALFGSDPSHRLIRDLLRETSEVLTTYLHSLSAPHTPPFDVIRLFSWEGLERRVLALIRATSENTSSMAADVSKGAPTEIEHINGYIVALGKRLGVPTPCHRMVREMVKFTSEVNGLRVNLPPGTTDRVTDRRKVITNSRGRGRKMSDRELDLEEKRLELEERKLVLAEEQVQQTKAARRRIHKSAKAIHAYKNELRGTGAAPGEASATSRSQSGMPRRTKGDEQLVDVLTQQLRSFHRVMAESAETEHDEAVSEDDAGPEDEGRPAKEIRQDASTSTATAKTKADTSPSSLDQLIDSVPRIQAECGDELVTVPAETPTESSEKDPNQTRDHAEPRTGTEDATPLDPPSTPSSAGPVVPPDAIDPLPSGLKPDVHIFNQYRDRILRGGFASSLDRLIIAAPRADPVWDLAGDHIVSTPSTTTSLIDQIRSRFGQARDGVGLGSTLDGLITSAPRQERTWPSQVGIDGGEKKGINGRFITSRTSGS